LQRVEAILATNLVGATPTEQVMPCSATTRARMLLAIAAGVPSRLSAPETSRKASSSASGSTSGVIAPKIAMTSFDTAAYTPRLGGTNTARGHIRRARPTGIADRTPNARAWYDAESTTPRPPVPPTTTGLPASSGASLISTLA
jgi:hypothetical protein